MRYFFAARTAKADNENTHPYSKTNRKQRKRIFDIEDEIEAKRDQLIRGLEKRISRKSTLTPLFTIQWEVI
jgi:hypothetical protein